MKTRILKLTAIIFLMVLGTSCSHHRTVDESSSLAYSQPSDWQGQPSSDADLLRLAVLDEPMDTTAAGTAGAPPPSSARRVNSADNLPAPAPESAVSPVVDTSVMPPEHQAVRRTWLWGSLLVIAAVLLGAKWMRDRNAKPGAQV